MRNDILKRLKAAESTKPNELWPLVVIFTPIGSDREPVECSRYRENHTGEEWHRLDGETMRQFNDRVEPEAEDLARRVNRTAVVRPVDLEH